jgi:hypothetical protein
MLSAAQQAAGLSWGRMWGMLVIRLKIRLLMEEFHDSSLGFVGVHGSSPVGGANGSSGPSDGGREFPVAGRF